VNRLAAAIKEENWEVAALYLLIGMQRAIEALPPETVEALLELIEDEEEPGPQGSHRRRQSGSSRRRRG
jgi:hypothetical protein